MRLLPIACLLILFIVLINFQPSITTDKASYPLEASCSHLAELTYNEMSTAQLKIAKNCDQREAAYSWQQIYGKMNNVELIKATVLDAS